MVLGEDIVKEIGINTSGLYVIAPFGEPWKGNKEKQLYKIGIAKNLRKRLDSYHTSYPRSFYIIAVIETKDRDKAYEIEKRIWRDIKSGKVKNVTHFREHIEGNVTYTARPRKGEWVHTNLSTILDYMRKLFMDERTALQMTEIDLKSAKKLHVRKKLK